MQPTKPSKFRILPTDLPQGRPVCKMFTKLSAFVRVNRDNLCFSLVALRNTQPSYKHLRSMGAFSYKFSIANSCDRKVAKHRVFLGRLLMAVNRAGSVVCWLWKEQVSSLADVQWCPFAFVLARNRCFNWSTTLSMTLCDMHACPCVNEALLQVTGHSGWYRGQAFVQCTHVPASVQKFCCQPDCLVNTYLERQSSVFPAEAAGLFHERA